MASINEKLNKIDSNIADMRIILNLEESASIENVKNALTPEKGFIVNEWNENGGITTMTFYGGVPSGAFTDSWYNGLLKEVKKVIVETGDTVNSSGFYQFRGEEIILKSIKIIKSSGLNYCQVKKVHLPEVTTLERNAIYDTNLVQLSLPKIETFSGIAGYGYSPMGNNTYLKAVWLGSKFPGERYTFNACRAIQKIYINRPRAEVETLSGYDVAFSGTGASGTAAVSTDVIVCNDDPGFLTQEEFDAIDWSTYTE